MAEAEPLSRRHLEIFQHYGRRTGNQRFAREGVRGIHFNADRASDGFFLPLAELPDLRRRLENGGLL